MSERKRERERERERESRIQGIHRRAVTDMIMAIQGVRLCMI